MTGRSVLKTIRVPSLDGDFLAVEQRGGATNYGLEHAVIRRKSMDENISRSSLARCWRGEILYSRKAMPGGQFTHFIGALFVRTR